jgi:TM2 domain-containing membrane protein YozV
MEMFSYLFLISIVFIILSLVHLFILNKKSLDEVIKLIKTKTNDLNILFYGTIRYIKYLLFTIGALSVNTGLYNALIPSQILFLTISNNRDKGIRITNTEIVGSIIMVSCIFFMIYNNCIKNNNINKKVLYGVAALIIALLLDIKDDTGFSKIAKNPYEDILMSSVVMFIISILVIAFRMIFLKKSFGINSGTNLLYLIAVPIILIEYIPTILEFASYDYLPMYVILCFFLIQSVIGFGLDRFYYGIKMTTFNIATIIGLVTGGAITIYGYYKSNVKSQVKGKGKDDTPTNPPK